MRDFPHDCGTVDTYDTDLRIVELCLVLILLGAASMMEASGVVEAGHGDALADVRGHTIRLFSNLIYIGHLSNSTNDNNCSVTTIAQ